MKKIRIGWLVLIVFNTFVFGQGDGFEGGDDPPPPTEGDGNIVSPIDMYVVYLGVIAIFFILYYFYKYRERKTV